LEKEKSLAPTGIGSLDHPVCRQFKAVVIIYEMGGACSAYGGEERHIQGFGGKPEGKRHLGDPAVDGRIILRWIFRKWYVGVWTG